MNEIEELYQLLQGKVKTGSLEEFTQRMQDPKSLAAVKKYAQEKIKPATGIRPLDAQTQGALDAAKAADKAQSQEMPVKVGVQAPKAGEFRLPTEQEMPSASGKEKILTGLEAVPITELQAKRKAVDERLNAMGQQFDDQAFNELTTKATALQQELQSLLPAVESGSAKQKSAFAAAQASLKEKETELQQIASKLDAAKPLEVELKLLADQHKAAKTPEQANALALAYNKKLGEYTAATSGATKEYNEKLASYTEQVKQANAEVAKLSPAALTRYNAIIRELKTIENDPVMAKRSQMSDEYNALVKEAEKLGTELKNRMPDGPLQQFTETSPAYRADRRRIIFEKLTPEQRAKELSSSLSLSENSYNPQGEITAKLNGFESYEEMRLATTAGLAAADLKQKPLPLTKEQVEAMNAFIQENYSDLPATSIAELEAHLSDMATTSPNNFWRTVNQNTTGRPIAGAVNSIISSPVTGVLGMLDNEGADVKASTKARILEEAYASKLGKVKSRMSDLEVAIDSDPALLEEYRTFAQSSAIISELQDKQRTPEEDQKLDEAFTAIGNLQTSEMKEYAALMQQYKSDYKNLENVVKLFPEELARRTQLSLKNNQTVINDNDSMTVKAAKQLDAIKGAATNTALRIGGNTLKTLTTLGDRIDRAVTGEEYTSATERYFEETGKFLESAIFLPELPEDMRSTIVQDLMGNSKIRGQAVLPGIASGLVQMGALIYGAKGLTGPLGGGLIGSSRALTALGFVFEFNDLYESFLDAGLSSRAALGYAAGISFVVARMEGINPQGVGISFFDQSVKKAITKLAKLGAKDFGTAFSQGSLHILKELGQENLQEFTQDGIKTIGNYLINKAHGTELDGSFDTPETAETALVTTGTTLIFSLLNGNSQIRGEAYSAAQYLAEKPEQLEAELQRRVSEGKLDMDMAREIFRYVTKVKETVDANKAKEAFDKKIEGYSPQKPMVEDYEGPTEITLDEYFAADYKVPSGVIVNWDGKKYEVRTDDKGTTLTLMEEVVEEQPEGESTEVAPQVELKPTKQKLTVEEFNELVQAPQGERVETELENAQVAEYQGKEYKITETQGDQVVLENYAGTARMTVPASEVKPFAVAPLVTITIEGQQFKADQKQQQALQLIDQVEQDQIEKINSSNLTDVQKKSQTKAIQEAFKRSRKEILRVKEELKTGQEVYFGGKKVKVKSLTKNTAKVEIDGVVTTVPRSSLSLSDTAPLDTLAQELKDEAQVKGHVYTIDSASLNLSEEDNRAYLKADTHTANIVGKVKKLLPALAKSGIKIKVYSDPLSAKEAALKAGADPRGVESRFYEGKEVVSELYQGEGLTEVTFEDGTTEIVKTDDIKTSSFGGYFDAKTKTILINAQVAGASTVEHEFLHPVIESILIDNPEIVTTFFEQIKKMPEWADLKDFVEQYDAREQPIEALIEFTARIIAPEFKYQTRRPTFKRAVVDFFRRIFRIAGPIVNINSKNVLDFAESLKKSFELGRTFDIKDTAGGFSIRAYHGTPHDFDKFTTEKIGTGEGAQAFGWGLYFTELEDIARYYADKLTKPQFSFNGEVITDEYVNTFLSNNLSSNGNITAGTIKYALQEAQEDYAENSEAAVKRAISTLEGMIGGEVSKVPNRNFYDVTLHKDKTEYNWLEWDKPVSDELLIQIKTQADKEGFSSLSKAISDELLPERDYLGELDAISETIDSVANKYGFEYHLPKQAAKYSKSDQEKVKALSDEFKAIDKEYRSHTRLEKTPLKGGVFYENWLSGLYFDSPKQASLFLLEAGIDGIKYPAESLSGKQARGFNYVVFDENAVTVNEKIRFSRALTIPEMELSFDKFRDLALMWKAYNPTKSEADFYEYVRANVDKRVNKGFMSAAFNDDATYLQKRKDAELDTRSKNLNAQSRGTLGYMADPNVPQFIKDRLKTEQLRYETEPNSVTEKTVDYIIQNYDLSNAEAVLESIQVPAVRTRLADKLIDRLNKLGRDAATAEEKTEYYYAALKLTENNIHYMRSLGRGIQIHSQYSKMDKEGVAFAVNKMMKINRSGLKKAHKTAIDRMVAYARLVERGQRKALITDEVKTQVLSGGKTKEQIRNLKESAAKKLRAIGAQGFSVAPDRQSLLDYGYYEFLDGRRSKASWVRHMTDRGLSDAADVYDYHNFGTAQNPETLADFSDRVESLSDLIGTPALAQAIGQPLADKINAEHRKRVVSALRDKYKKDLKKKGIAGQMAAALITAVEKGQYDSDVLLDELAKTVGAVELSQDDIKIIDEIYKRAATYPEGRIRDEELAKAWDYIYARSRDSLKYGDMYWSFFYANILSGPGTHALNLIENALNIILEPTVKIIDQITRVNTQGLSRRTVAWNMASGVLRGLFGAGVREGLSVVVTGKEKFRGANKYFDSNALEQISRGTAGKGLLTTLLRPAATVMRYVPRALAAADAFYNQAHFEMGSATVAAQIVRQEVDTKVIDKKDAKARYYEILGDSSWWVTALRDAEIEIKEAYRLQGKELTNDFDTWYKIKTRAREIVLNKRQEAASKYVYNDIGGASSDMAAIGTYTNAPRGVLGAVATHAAGLVADVPIARHVIPFINIVANVYNRQLDYTPWGLARAAAILTKGGKSDFIAEGREKYSWNTHEGAAKQHIIKSVMGTAAMIAAYLLFWDDDDNVFTDEEAFTIHGRGPTDYAKKKEMEARGWKPYSFQYKGKFYAFNWTPFNLALSFIANAIDKQRYGKNDEDKSALDNTLIAFNLLGSTLLSAAFVKSAADFLSFFQEGKEESDRLWNFLGRTAISSVPAPMALFNTIHSTVDNTKYQADSVSQGILRNIPIAKTQLKPALNAFGEVITKTGISQDMTWYRVGELTGLNRFMSALDTNDTTFAWLHQNGLWPPVIGKTKELFGNKVSDETHYKLVEICGPNIKRMIEFDKAYIDKLIAEDGVAEANKYINQKLKNRIVDFVEDAIIDQYNFKPDEETIIELKDVDWEKVRKYVTDATNEMMVPVE